MNHQRILKSANTSMLLSLIAFIGSAILAYGFESQLPLMLVAVLHVAQLFLAGCFKVSYVVRLVAQKQLGLAIN
jgi:hypothetical protein